MNNECLPGKNVKPFFDGTLLMHFIQNACLYTKGINETYVYCTQEDIKKYLLPGIKFHKRPEYLNSNNYGIMVG